MNIGRIVQVAILLGIISGVSVLVANQSRHSNTSRSPNKSTKLIKDIQVLLRPGATYRLTFSKELPISNPPAVLTEDTVYHEWFGNRIQILEQSPKAIRFRVKTLKETLQEAEEANKLGTYIDPDFVKFEYEHGVPFGLNYAAIGRDRMRFKISLMFSVETDRSRRHAERVIAKEDGIEIVPVQPPEMETKPRFFLLPERKDKTLYI